MMINVGEQLVSSYLRYIRLCDFTQTNLYTESQGEIDVVGVNLADQQTYICEVAIHLGGLNYGNLASDLIPKLTDKFCKNIKYAREYLQEYNPHFMLWAPIVRNAGIRRLRELKANIKERYEIDIEYIINQKFQECLSELRNYAKKEDKDLKCPVLRLMQIEESLNKNVKRPWFGNLP